MDRCLFLRILFVAIFVYQDDSKELLDLSLHWLVIGIVLGPRLLLSALVFSKRGCYLGLDHFQQRELLKDRISIVLTVIHSKPPNSDRSYSAYTRDSFDISGAALVRRGRQRESYH